MQRREGSYDSLVGYDMNIIMLDWESRRRNLCPWNG